MGDNTKIEWSDATWNPTTGCDKVSPGCDNCYAMSMSVRLKAMGSARYQNDGDPRTSGPGFGFTAHPETIDRPLRWKRPRKVFVNSMSDLFHPAIGRAKDVDGYPFLAQVFATMAAASQHTFQILTKRPQIMRAVLADPMFRLDVNAALMSRGFSVMPGGMSDPDFRWPSNIWLGTSIESDMYTFRADHLRRVGAAVRFISAEPLLGPLPSLDLTGIDWLIVGGESGPVADVRPMHPDWVRDLRDKATATDTALFFKQWGAWGPGGHPYRDSRYVDPGGRWQPWARDGAVLMNFARKSAHGNELDGRTWTNYPDV